MKGQVLLVLLVVGGLYWRSHKGQTSAIVVILPNGETVQGPGLTGDWRTDILALLGNTQPSEDILTVMEAWHRAEGGDATFNWLNTTQKAEGATCYNEVPCVKNYVSYEQGINATVSTLTSDHLGYATIVQGLQQNDVVMVIEGIRQSPWGSSADTVIRVYNELSPPLVVANRPFGRVQSNSIDLGGDCGWNVKVALEARNGALSHIVLRPGDTFSFNGLMGDPEIINYRWCAGQPGGNWCNLAARYSQVARALRLAPQFQDHGAGDLGGGSENSVLIWNVGGVPGTFGENRDLEFTNTTPDTIYIDAELDGTQVTLVGST